MNATGRANSQLRIARALRALDDARDAMQDAAAASLGISWNDVRALRIVARTAGVKPTSLARQLHLTTGSVTSLLDRMEGMGFLRRERDPGDRRGVRIHLDAEGARAERQLFNSAATDLAKWLARRSTRDLGVIAEFLENAHALTGAARSRIARQK